MASDNLSQALFELKDRQRRRRGGSAVKRPSRAERTRLAPALPFRPRAFDPVSVFAAIVLGCAVVLQLATMIRYGSLL